MSDLFSAHISFSGRHGYFILFRIFVINEKHAKLSRFLKNNFIHLHIFSNLPTTIFKESKQYYFC